MIKYNDLISFQEETLERLKKSREIAKINGVTQFFGYDRNIEYAARILKLLKHSRKEMQPDLFQVNVNLNHK